MKKKIAIGCILTVLMLVSLPNVSAISDNLHSDDIISKDFEQKDIMDSAIWDIFAIYIQMMYHQRLARASLWDLVAELPGMTGTILTLIQFRAFLLKTRTEVSRDVLTEILNVLQQLFP